MIWDFEVLRRNSSAAVVQDSTILEAKAIDDCCHPVDLEKAECNCSNFSKSVKCLVAFLRTKNPIESAPEPPDIGILNVQDNDAFDSNEEDQDCESNHDLHAENFKVKGSFFHEHYQQALLKCDNAKDKTKLLLHVLSSNRTIFRTKMQSNSRFILTMNGISLVTVMLGKFLN